jgi:hypothetical protein
MTNLKGAAILGAITVAGALLLTSFPASSATSVLLAGARRVERTCRTTGPVEPVCKFVAGLMDRWGAVPLGDPLPENVAEAGLRKLRAPVKRMQKSGCCDGCALNPGAPGCSDVCQTPCGSGYDRCDSCIAAVQSIEAYLATNGTMQSLADTMSTACADRFDDPATIDQCVTQVYELAFGQTDRFLVTYPPLTACRSSVFRACP